MSLTTMQELFVRALLADPRRNGTAAAVAAGYSPKRAKKTAGLVDDPQVQPPLHAKQLAALGRASLDLTYVLMGIRNSVERYRGLGKVFNPVSALAAWKEEAQLPQQNSEQWNMNRSRCRLLPVQRSQIGLIYGQEAFKNNLAKLQFHPDPQARALSLGSAWLCRTRISLRHGRTSQFRQPAARAAPNTRSHRRTPEESRHASPPLHP